MLPFVRHLRGSDWAAHNPPATQVGNVVIKLVYQGCIRTSNTQAAWTDQITALEGWLVVSLAPPATF